MRLIAHIEAVLAKLEQADAQLCGAIEHELDKLTTQQITEERTAASAIQNLKHARSHVINAMQFANDAFHDQRREIAQLAMRASAHNGKDAAA